MSSQVQHAGAMVLESEPIASSPPVPIPSDSDPFQVRFWQDSCQLLLPAGSESGSIPSDSDRFPVLFRQESCSVPQDSDPESDQFGT